MRAAAAALAALLAAPLAAKPFPRRGVLEGFYGRPWSWETRRAMAAWMAPRGLDLLVVAPKDEPLQRADWRRPLPADYLVELQGLAAYAGARGVGVAWTLSPLGADWGDPGEARAAADKLLSVARAGVRELVVACDDMEPDPRQVLFANRVREAVVRELPAARFTFVPALYWGGAAGSDYLDMAARRLHPDFRVAWTGPHVISRRITEADAAAFARAVRHPLVLGDNYPVQDRLAGAGRLFLGPLTGRDPGLAAFHEAYLANASPSAEASKIPLAAAARYAADPEGYDPASGGPARWLGVLARECSSSWLSFPETEGKPGGAARAVAEYYRTGDPGPLRAVLDELAALPDGLQEELARAPGLYDEAGPWAEALGARAEAARSALERHEAWRRGSAPPPGESYVERLPAVAGGLALERFMGWVEARLAGGAGRAPLDPAGVLAARAEGRADELAAREALGSLEDGAVALAAMPEAERREAAELSPWVAGLAEAARGAPLAALRLKLAALPLLASQRLLEDFLRETEAGFVAAEPPKGLPWTLLLWLAWRGRTSPGSVPVRLAFALEARRLTGREEALAGVLGELAAFPARLRRALGPALLPELGPWLDKVGAYGEAGRMALELARRAKAGRLPSSEVERWRQRREALRSANGLELALELRRAVVAYRAWAALPERERPRGLALDLPDDPSRL